MSRLSKNILYNLVGQLILVVLGLVAVKYVFKQLGEDALGIIYFTAMLNIILTGVLEKGVHATAVREISTHLNDGSDYVRNFIRTGALVCWCVYLLLAAIVYFGAAVLVEDWINLRSIDAGTATTLLQILGIASLSALPRSFYASLLRGLQRMEFNNAVDVTINAIQQIGTIVILSYSSDVLYVAYWLAACFVLSMLAYLVVTATFFSLRSLLPGYSSEVVKKNWSFAEKMTRVSILAMIHNQAEKIIVSKWLPIGAFGYFGVAYNAVSKVGVVSSAVALAALPSLSMLFKADDRVGLIAQYRKLQDFVCFMTVPMFAAVQFASLPLFTYLFDAEVADTLFLPVTFLCIGFYLNGTLNLQYQFSVAAGKPDIAFKSNLYALTILPITALLIYTLGLAGAGLSWVIFNVFIAAYAVPRICRECIGIPVHTWYAHMCKVLSLAGVTYGVAWIALTFFGAYSATSLASAYVIATIAFLVGTYALIGGELKRSLLRPLRASRAEDNIEPRRGYQEVTHK